MIQIISTFWLRYIHPRLISLIATIGIVGLTSCLLILFVVAKLAEEVLEKEAFAFDTSFLLWLHQFANPSLDNLMLAITSLGSPTTVVVVAALTLGTLWWRHYRVETYIFVLTCLGGLILNTGLKLFFSKPRPQLWTLLISEKSFSFPSGHALGSMVLYGFIGYILATHYPKFSQIIYTLAVILIVAIGISRLYLGVHWPTDIIAGYSIGFLWLMICITMLKLQRLRQGQSLD
ncbi:phosphatase PAP2 family protein (plasmid) [Brasilonema octagenarum UFV-E1]|uniref:Phosphatase PAP2 family protein n=1 Tax=Brasilonema sennae CENA114 TaxID=415709 RepID=A0A856MTP1_9CYAN|nr:phosphatase PAP2 family protein [Brasilonema sennae]QDL12626.1 phosphatase PAP2 family protein [Brasilonema sennae CENA114]QDL19021.1 phosphatase PAP2 family protein [Brasilonema octagenarum UFV-E1]